MTRPDKAQVLWAWRRRLREGTDQVGDPDSDIVPWCREINRLRGFCTLQSCAGHPATERGGVVEPAHLWLWMDKPTSEVWDRQAFRLAMHENVERVSRLYTSWGQEVASITFAGNERDLLTESLAVIMDFLLEVEAQVGLERSDPCT